MKLNVHFNSPTTMAAKAPKKPKASAGLKAWQDYDTRKSAYDNEMKKKQSIQKKHSK